MAERRIEFRQDVLDSINSFLSRGIKEGATDIHWEPFVELDKEEIVVRFRIDGILKDMDRLPIDRMNFGLIINAIKNMADMDPTKRRHEQDGRFSFVNEGVEYDVRVSSMPTVNGEKVVMRLMNRSKYCVNLKDLGMSDDVLRLLDGMVGKNQGFMIIVGPTGSGKTTTLYSILNHIYSREKNICTIEDPIEVKFPGMNQIQVEPEFGMTFVAGLRAILRQDPDVIAVGEIRDAETMRTAMQAALIGAMVFSTLHAKDAINTVTRLLDMGVEPYFIANALTGVVSQRLVRLVCKICKGRGCIQCLNTGYKKRVGVFEVLKINDKIRALILKNSTVEQLRSAAIEDNLYIPFSKTFDVLLAQGLTTREEIDRVLTLS